MIPCHTHRADAPDAILSLPPERVEPFLVSNSAAVVSTGVHPWSTSDDVNLGLLERVAAIPQVVAIGETGLDRLRGASLERQSEIFKRHIELSEELQKPLVIHCVRAWSELLAMRRALRPSMPWAVHGFRGGPELAKQLLDHGLWLSLGSRYNTATALIIPDDRLLVETDEDTPPVEGTIAALTSLRGHVPP